MNAHHERGIAIVLALFLMTAMSALAVSLMFLSQTETYASMNYRMMSQARYGGEAAVQKAANFLLDTAQYSPPGTVADPLSNYNRTVSPVTYNGQPVILSATASQASNYPVAAVRDAFNAAAQGTLAADNISVAYGSYATLLQMQQFESYGGGQSVVQTWQISGAGVLSGARRATVEVTALVETPKVSANSYAAFATANTCDAIYFHGNVTVNSYDSQRRAADRRRQQHAGERRRRRHEWKLAHSGKRGRARQPVHAADRRGNLRGRRRHGLDRGWQCERRGQHGAIADGSQLPAADVLDDAADDRGDDQRCAVGGSGERLLLAGLGSGRQLHRQCRHQDGDY